MKKVIQKVDGHIGSGKSLTTELWYADLVAQNGGNPVPATFATPTNGLSDQYQENFEAAGIRSTVVSQEIYRSSSEEYARQCDAGEEGIVVTHNMVALTTKANTANRLLVLDEAITPLDTLRIRFENPEQVRELNVVETPDAPDFYEVVRSNAMNCALAHPYSRDDQYKNFGKVAIDLAEYTHNEHYRVVIDQKSFNEAASGNAFVKLDKKGNVIEKPTVWLQFTIFMLPTIVDAYKDVLAISANFDETLMSLMWSKDVEFRTNEFIQSRLGYQDMTHVADRVEIHFVPKKNLSKTFFASFGNGKEEVGAQRLQDDVATCLGEMFPGREHIYCTNNHPTKNKKYRWNLEGKGGQRVIMNPFGWNSLRHCRMAVFLAAINYDPETIERLFAFYGITHEQAKNAICFQAVYQFIGRTAVRMKDDPNPDAGKIVLVLPDEGAAQYVHKLFGCDPITNPIQPLPIDLGEQPKRGRPRIEKTADQKKAEAAQKKREYRKRMAAEKAAQVELEWA